MNILLTLDKNYLRFAKTLIRSINASNNQTISFYIISPDLNQEDFKEFNIEKNSFEIIRFDDSLLLDAKVTYRYPKSIYYRIFASKLLDEKIDRILYLDPDIIVLKSLQGLYQMDFEDNYFIAATNVKGFLRKFNEIKNRAPKKAPYINTGVMLMNLSKLRKEQSIVEVFEYIKKYNRYFTLPDQDIVSGLYGDKIKLVDNIIYNLSDREITKYNLSHIKKIDLEEVKNKTVIIHYYGKNKPWNSDYKGILKIFFDQYDY